MEHGLPVAGYVPQSEQNIALVNENKRLEEQVLRQIDKHKVWADTGAVAAYDQRMVAIATTKVQEAFMWLNRAVFQPKRIDL